MTVSVTRSMREPWLIRHPRVAIADAPRYAVGNRTLLILVCTNIVVYALTKLYYVMQNRRRDLKWQAMTEDQRVDYVATTQDQGNRRLDFRFAH